MGAAEKFAALRLFSFMVQSCPNRYFAESTWRLLRAPTRGRSRSRAALLLEPRNAESLLPQARGPCRLSSDPRDLKEALMLRKSTTRAHHALALLTAAALLFFAAAPAAHAAPGLDWLARAWTRLSALWGEDTSQILPGGLAAGRPNRPDRGPRLLQANEGTSILPGGNPAPVTSDQGSEINPNG